jgi:hypothetical protein
MSHRPRRLLLALIPGALAVWVATGCMTDSVAPTEKTLNGSRGPSAASATRGAISTSDGLLGLLGDDDNHRGRDGGGIIGSILDPLVRLVYQVVRIPFGQGGSVTNGRWRLDVPAGAIAGDATVSIGVQSSSSFSCQLNILPLELNHFSTPVTVTANCRDIEREKLKDWVVWWFDPMQGKWVILENSKVNLDKGTVSAPLPHCSAYAAGPRDGKAGW